MHELSIAASIVDAVTESAAAYPGARVQEVRLRVGALASVIEDSLQFCWGITVDGTPLEGSKLVVQIVPVMAHCASCGQDGVLESLQSFRCPHCHEPVTDLRQGRELEIESIEIEDKEEIEDKDEGGIEEKDEGGIEEKDEGSVTAKQEAE